MSDRLAQIELQMSRGSVLNTENGCSVANITPGDASWLLAKVRRLATAEAEAERLNGMRCETCKHNDYGDCARTLHIERSDMGTKFESWTSCDTLGGGCRAWEARNA